MQQSLTSIESKMDTMCTGMDSIKHKLEKHYCCIAGTERLSSVKDTVMHRSEQLLNMEKALIVISAKNKDLEARSCSSNMRIMGIPETTNIGKTEEFVESLLIVVFGPESFSKILIAEGAHHALMAQPPPEAAGRPIITWLLNYRDTVLLLARERCTLQFIYPDFTLAVQEACRKYFPIKQKLQQANVRYAMLYSACLCITHQGKAHIFNNPQHPGEYLKQNLRRDSPPPDRCRLPDAPRHCQRWYGFQM
ncbi:hypothetical protein NDU88_005150 [Pleurodeles waltl]|uniref:Uncharacterized protein n=1 Tax=Pleurodeles waltl TaxID=8319 RepID=A0AAV7LKP3_PLEWA|nr:hypothetical protein NDU88_005150 [Pleurodeles waltl]